MSLIVKKKYVESEKVKKLRDRIKHLEVCLSSVGKDLVQEINNKHKNQDSPGTGSICCFQPMSIVGNDNEEWLECEKCGNTKA